MPALLLIPLVFLAIFSREAFGPITTLLSFLSEYPIVKPSRSLYSSNIAHFPISFSCAGVAAILVTLYCETRKKHRIVTFAAACCTALLTILILAMPESGPETYYLAFIGLFIFSLHLSPLENSRSNDDFWFAAHHAFAVWIKLFAYALVCFFVLRFGLHVLQRGVNIYSYGAFSFVLPALMLTTFIAAMLHTLSRFPRPLATLSAPSPLDEQIHPHTKFVVYFSTFVFIFIVGVVLSRLATHTPFIGKIIELIDYPAVPLRLSEMSGFIRSTVTLACAISTMALFLYVASYPLRAQAGKVMRFTFCSLPLISAPLVLTALLGVGTIVSTRPLNPVMYMQGLFLSWALAWTLAIIFLPSKIQIKWISASLAILCLVSLLPPLSPRDMSLRINHHILTSLAAKAGMLDEQGKMRPAESLDALSHEQRTRMSAIINYFESMSAIDSLSSRIGQTAVTDPIPEFATGSKSYQLTLALNLVAPPPKENRRKTETVNPERQNEHDLRTRGFDYMKQFSYSLRASSEALNLGRIKLPDSKELGITYKEEGALYATLRDITKDQASETLEFPFMETFTRQLPRTDLRASMEPIVLFAENDDISIEITLSSLAYSYLPEVSRREDIKITYITGAIRFTLKQ